MCVCACRAHVTARVSVCEQCVRACTYVSAHEWLEVRNWSPKEVAVGYLRVVYGDHGPYVECSPEQVQFSGLRKNAKKLHPCRYYDEWYSPDGVQRISRSNMHESRQPKRSILGLSLASFPHLHFGQCSPRRTHNFSVE